LIQKLNSTCPYLPSWPLKQQLLAVIAQRNQATISPAQKDQVLPLSDLGASLAPACPQGTVSNTPSGLLPMNRFPSHCISVESSHSTAEFCDDEKIIQSKNQR